jgi:hypothetical protein
MAPPVELLGTYLQLASGAELRQQPLVRDRVLVLAAVLAAQIEGLAPIAACCRERVLAHNRGHMLARWPTVAEARRHEDFQSLVNQLATRYGTERVEQLVQQLGLEASPSRAAYASDGEYAAALLNADWDDLQQRFGVDPAA